MTRAITIGAFRHPGIFRVVVLRSGSRHPAGFRRGLFVGHWVPMRRAYRCRRNHARVCSHIAGESTWPTPGSMNAEKASGFPAAR